MHIKDIPPQSKIFLDTFVSHRASELTSYEAPLLSDAERSWHLHHLLSYFTGPQPQGMERQHIANLIRRVEAAREEYVSGRQYLVEFVEHQEHGVTTFFRALRHFEVCLAQTYQAVLFVRAIENRNSFCGGDQSPRDRLNRLHNISKHMDERISNGDIPNEVLAPIWLTPSGITAQNTEECMISLSYVELTGLLSELGAFLDGRIHQYTAADFA